FFSSRRRHTRFSRDWSSDVCSSDLLKEYGDKLSADKKGVIEAGLEKLKTAYAAKNFAGIDTASAELQNAWNAASEEMYAASQQGGAEQPQGDAGQQDNNKQGGDDVQDVEFEEVK